MLSMSRHHNSVEREWKVVSTAGYGELPIAKVVHVSHRPPTTPTIKIEGERQGERLTSEYGDLIDPLPPSQFPLSLIRRLNLPSRSLSPSSQVLALDIGPMIEMRKFVPSIFRQKPSLLLPCSPLLPGYEHFWWRAIAAAYFLRPNEYTLNRLEEFKDHKVFTTSSSSSDSSSDDGRCVSAYVRHGDKGSEMKLVEFQKYALAAEDAWEKGLLDEGITTTSSSSKERVFYFGTEDLEVIKQAEDWAAKSVKSNMDSSSAISVRYLPNLSEVIDSNRLIAKRHEDEYLSYLANLQNIIHCRMSVCTHLSNFCRVVDELRATVGGKANRYLAEVNEETCLQKKACIKKNALIPEEKFKELDPRLW